MERGSDQPGRRRGTGGGGGLIEHQYREVLDAAGLGTFVDCRVDRVMIQTERLNEGPAAVRAGRAGHFCAFVGVDRVGDSEALGRN